MSRLSTPYPDIDPLTTVVGRRGTPYPCPDIPAVDHHIAGLYKRIEHAAPWFPDIVRELWAEIDLLLDRRIWLEMDHSAIGDAAA
ncbi:hypothetical protein [Pseudonocardia acidicola]|uniref:Uncharacterized protein n=1 Tax=Pseudonocardia acidicola TaxID=2724939 RepID=A0ABX1S8H9_9PSEU|nr:hypothetical protein [Pseudonocardia acidicola]NMH97866.1 hypothetical protein [Pseudonocardia acidicola]